MKSVKVAICFSVRTKREIVLNSKVSHACVKHVQDHNLDDGRGCSMGCSIVVQGDLLAYDTVQSKLLTWRRVKWKWKRKPTGLAMLPRAVTPFLVA